MRCDLLLCGWHARAVAVSCTTLHTVAVLKRKSRRSSVLRKNAPRRMGERGGITDGGRGSTSNRFSFAGGKDVRQSSVTEQLRSELTYGKAQRHLRLRASEAGNAREVRKLRRRLGAARARQHTSNAGLHQNKAPAAGSCGAAP